MAVGSPSRERTSDFSLACCTFWVHSTTSRVDDGCIRGPSLVSDLVILLHFCIACQLIILTSVNRINQTWMLVIHCQYVCSALVLRINLKVTTTLAIAHYSHWQCLCMSLACVIQNEEQRTKDRIICPRCSKLTQPGLDYEGVLHDRLRISIAPIRVQHWLVYRYQHYRMVCTTWRCASVNWVLQVTTSVLVQLLYYY